MERKGGITACFTRELRTSEPVAAVGAPPLVRMDLKPREMSSSSWLALFSGYEWISMAFFWPCEQVGHGGKRMDG